MANSFDIITSNEEECCYVPLVQWVTRFVQLS